MDAFPVYGADSQEIDKVNLAENIFNVTVNPSVVHRAVVMQRARERQGTASTIGRGEVSGGGKKPWKQKHTGRARAGSSRSPIWRGGGTVFGPKPRSYSPVLPKKMYRAALKGALSSKVASDSFVVFEELVVSDMKTNKLAQLLGKVKATGKVLLVIGNGASELFRIGRNIPNLKILNAKDLNVYDVLWCDKLVVTRAELDRIQEIWV